MSEKVTSMRLNEEDLEQFKAFAKNNGLNQQQAFNSLIALAELEKAKNVVGDRAKSIDTFRDTINKAIGMYVNSLEENMTAEQTIREELSKELKVKDNTITNLYDQLQEVKENNNNLDNEYKLLEDQREMLANSCRDFTTNIEDLKNQLDIANRNNNNLQEQLAEYKQYKDNYKTIEKEFEQLKNDIEKKDVVIRELTADNLQLKDKINNDSEMINFYKSNNIELKDNIKALEDKYDKQIENIKADHQKVLQEQLKVTNEQLSNKHDIELSKKDLEIEKLKNEIANLISKNHKTVVNKKEIKNN